MLPEVYDAFLAADVPEATARKAAEAVALYETRLAGIERELAVVRWMVGTNLVLTIAMLTGLGTMYLKLTDLALQLGTLAGRLH